jgi:predicted deacylase
MKTRHKIIDDIAPATRWMGMVQCESDASIEIPIIIVRGSADGPTLLLTGGVHGDEYEGPAAIQRFMCMLDPSDIKGTVIGIPVVNVTAWRNRSRFSAVDGADLNRSFSQPSSPDHSRILAEFVFDTFVRSSDVLIDIHSGGQRLDHLPLIGWYRNGDGQAEFLARRFHREMHPWLVPDAAGVLSYEAHRIGKVAFGAEWHGGGTLDLRGLVAIVSGFQHTAALLKMLDPIAEITTDNRTPIAGDYQTTEHAGLFIPTVKLGQIVDQNEPIGIIYDDLGEVVTTLYALGKGIIAGLPHLSYVKAGERVVYIG